MIKLEIEISDQEILMPTLSPMHLKIAATISWEKPAGT
jgi:hypothetical protein